MACLHDKEPQTLGSLWLRIQFPDVASAYFETAMQSVLDYLNRPACKSCVIDTDGIFLHCEECLKLYNAALSYAQELNQQPTWAQRQQIDKDRLKYIDDMKHSHDWANTQTFIDAARTRMAPFASHCKRCGLPFLTWKVKPSKCPKQK